MRLFLYTIWNAAANRPQKRGEASTLMYREIFEKYYPRQAEMIVDFWMPNKSWKGCDVDVELFCRVYRHNVSDKI